MAFHWFDDLQDLSGALHLHTVKSNGAGTIVDVVSAAQRAGLSFIIITDHSIPSRGAEEEPEAEGWHENVFVLGGEEVSLGSARFIILGHRGALDGSKPIAEELREARSRGGITVAVPPEDTTAQLPVPAALAAVVGDTPKIVEKENQVDLPIEAIDGWEFWCGLEDWARGRMDRSPMTDPFTRVEHVGLRGPRRGAMRMWDALSRQSRIFGFAGLNAHGRSWSTTAPGAALPYETLFKSLGTHVLVPPLPVGDSAAARTLLLDALRAGRFHTSHRSIAPPEGFRFVAEIPGAEPCLEGGQVSYHPRARIRVRLPQQAAIKLIHNGSLLFTAEGRELDFPVVGPGVYRGEAWLDRHPWIYSNPIWFTPPTPEEMEAVRSAERQRVQEEAQKNMGDILDWAT